MRARALGLALFVIAAQPAFAADVPSVQRGRLLYENHCQVCHTSDIHRRPNRMPLNAAGLRGIVDQWQKQEKLNWSEQEIADVVQFLRETRYRF
jgi:mono/diheme cytochrome c family protein